MTQYDKLKDLAQMIVDRWGKDFDNKDEEISGCDAVDSLGNYVELAKDALSSPAPARRDKALPKLKFFDTEQEVIDYLTQELLATLRDDLDHCKRADDLETYRDLKAKIHDIEAIEDRLTIAETVPANPSYGPSYGDLVAALGTAVAEWAYLFPEKFDDDRHKAQSRKNLKQAERTFKQALKVLDKTRKDGKP